MKKYILPVSLLILAIFPIISLFHSGLPITHDGQDHVARIANFYQNLTEGNIIPRWAGNLNWGYGHPILEFLYPLPSYFASVFHFLGFSLVDSVKIVFALGTISSFIFMYLWLSQFVSRFSALFGAVLYTYAPYRFVELYVRGDIGEHLAFVFIPLVLFYVYRIYKHNQFLDAIFGAFSLAFLILAHNAISLMFTPFIIAYCFYLIYLSKYNKYLMLNTLFLILLGFGISAFFWIPGLLEGKYTLRNIVTAGGYIGKFVSFKDLLYGPWNYGGSGVFTVQFGPFQWLVLLVTPFVIQKFKKEKEKYFLLIASFFYCLFAIFIMLQVSNFVWERIILLQNFQFPWRFLAIVVFSTAVVGALLIDKISIKFRDKLVVLFILIIIGISSFYWKPKDYLHKSESFYTGVYNSTTDTGESAPIWSIRFMEKRPEANLEIVDGDARVENIERRSTYHKYKVVVNKKTIFRENTVYFPGWEMKANGKQVDVDFHTQHYNGVMKFTLDEGHYNVEAKYVETKLRFFADTLSFASLGSILGGLFLYFLIKIKTKK